MPDTAPNPSRPDGDTDTEFAQLNLAPGFGRNVASAAEWIADRFRTPG